MTRLLVLLYIATTHDDTLSPLLYAAVKTLSVEIGRLRLELRLYLEISSSSSSSSEKWFSFRKDFMVGKSNDA